MHIHSSILGVKTSVIQLLEISPSEVCYRVRQRVTTHLGSDKIDTVALTMCGLQY